MNKLLGVTCALALLGCGKKDDQVHVYTPDAKTITHVALPLEL